MVGYSCKNLKILIRFVGIRSDIMAGRNEKDRESKSDRFIRVAERRTAKVLTDLRLLGQCANRRTYEYSPDQVRKIFREIRRSLGAVEKRFEETGVRTQFKLK
jgi:hypothetical protein